MSSVMDDDDTDKSAETTITIDEFTLEFRDAMQAAFDKALARRLVEKVFESNDEFAVNLRQHLNL